MTPLALLSQIPPAWKKRIAAIAAGVLVLLAVFEAGRFSAPRKILEHTKLVHDSIKLEAEAKTDTAAETTAAAATSSKKVTRDRSIEETHLPDGTVKIVKRDVETVGEDHALVTSTSSAIASTSTKTSTETEHSTTDKLRIVETARPQWRAGLLVGLTTSSSRVVVPELLFPVIPVDAGVTVERRIAGTVWMGAWLNTDKSAGVSLSMEFGAR